MGNTRHGTSFNPGLKGSSKLKELSKEIERLQSQLQKAQVRIRCFQSSRVGRQQRQIDSLIRERDNLMTQLHALRNVYADLMQAREEIAAGEVRAETLQSKVDELRRHNEFLEYRISQNGQPAPR